MFLKVKPKNPFTEVNDLCFSMHHFKIQLFNLLQIVKLVFVLSRKERVEDRGSESPLVGGSDKRAVYMGFNLREMQIVRCNAPFCAE